MKPSLYGIFFTCERDGDVATDPKTGGLDKPGRDGDVATDPKTGGLDRPGQAPEV